MCLGGVLPDRLYFWLSIGIRLAPPDAVSLEELSCKSTQMQHRSFNPNNRSNHQRRRSAMQSSHSPILELGHSVNSSPELRGASRSPRRRVRPAPSSRSRAVAAPPLLPLGMLVQKIAVWRGRSAAAGIDRPGGRNFGYSMVNLLIFTTFSGQYTYCLHFYDKGVPQSALGRAAFYQAGGL